MLPRPKIRTPEGHKYTLNGLELLKLSAVYGANAAGKSNLVKALGLLQYLATGAATSSKVHEAHFKFDDATPCKQVLAVEFVQEGKPYYYAVEITDGAIATEELYRSGLGKAADVLIFERKKMGETVHLTFSDAFEKDAESRMLKSILIHEFLEPQETILPWLANRQNPYLNEAKAAFQWFSQTLQIINPETKVNALSLRLDTDQPFKSFANDLLCAYGLGISKIDVEEMPLKEIFGENNEAAISAVRKKMGETKNGFLTIPSRTGDELIIARKNDDFVAKHLTVTQSNKGGNEAAFNIDELSDGTIRLLDFLPLFQGVADRPKVYVVDELERSIHPSLAKELVTKFSHDKDTKGQLIFTTHESNLLDQSIFRQDEVWFAEKSPDGSTDLYSLSDFKEHHTIDIRKGYLNGRYGAVPFLANLHELNWHAYDTH